MKYTSISDIYPIYEEIKLSDTFLSKLYKRRVRRYIADKSQLALPVNNLDIENLKEVPDGKLAFDYKEAHFEGFFHKGNRKKLYVTLGGGCVRYGKRRDIPRYQRWSYYSFSDCYTFSLEDPMYFMFPDLRVSWFYGTKEANFREYTAKVIEKIAACCGIEKKDVVFFSESAGGTAAIHCAQIFGGGAIAVSINPQLNFEYSNADLQKFKDDTGIDLHEEDTFGRNDMCSIIQNGTDCKFILIENCRSDWDYSSHLTYLCKKLNITPAFGLDRFGNLVTWIYEANGPSPHGAVEDRNLFLTIDFLTELVASNENLDRYKPLYQFFGEFWFEKYRYVENISNIQKADSVIKLGSSALNMQSFECMLKEQTLNLQADKDNFYYKIDKLECNTIYNVVLKDVENTLQEDDVVIGIYDSARRIFYDKCSVKTGENNYTFAIKDINSDMVLCIVAGNTPDCSLNIGALEIYKRSLADI